jgi:hypothetical protein
MLSAAESSQIDVPCQLAPVHPQRTLRVDRALRLGCWNHPRSVTAAPDFDRNEEEGEGIDVGAPVPASYLGAFEAIACPEGSAYRVSHATPPGGAAAPRPIDRLRC